MAYRNKTYIAFDGDNDMHYYRLMTAWKANDGFSLNFHNAHDLNTARDSSQEESIKRQLRERFSNSKQLVVLIGANTKYLTKFVKWEMEVALRLGLPIIGVNLNGSRQMDDRCPPTIRDQLVVYTSFNHNIIEHAMDHWPTNFQSLRAAGTTGPHFYNDDVYRRLGL
ncbi:TPA: TIR domain-containing protein [Pseudomonas aeruginosa]|uniref:TIR domain-containing protein n=1 Tax=Gammaproteobacteria TaxID=1236 RepID=UPI00053F1A2E|nr:MULTISPECIES: TIR domain-containing protein [Gammaproteobacteria]EIU5457927.1 TIR domain-containing protein [Pseudomonas aeruginosa]EIU5538931.1 TIR domain-containing protein [Pseudomonas aeruginosa]MCI3209259.1 molecular chaperone Tir [Pseudomonas aeruginosa]MDE5195654.1 TIR domain-containing protein [Pseudomonas aeruginosa]MDX6060078.1 TIR domain-containing protein [Pseudomonas aeruginosa]